MIAGSVAVVDRGADDLVAAGRRLEAVADGVARDAVDATSDWDGVASDAAFAGLVRLANHGRIGVDVVTRCSVVLRRFADELDAAQRRAVGAQADLDRARAAADALGPLDPGTAMRRLQIEHSVTAAKSVLDATVDQAWQANVAAAAQIRALMEELAGMAPPAPAAPSSSGGSVGDWVHGGLDLIGLVPFLGEPADAINAVYYAAEGDGLNAGLSMAAVVPGAGAAATGAKLGKKAAKLTDAEKTAQAAEAAREAARFGYRAGDVVPGADRATIPPGKITGYALNPNSEVGRHKARVLTAATGFDLSTADELARQVAVGVRQQPAAIGALDDHGQRFTVHVPITGPTGSAVLRTGWIIDKPGDAPRLVTLYISKGDK